MLSSSIETQVRGDERLRCSQAVNSGRNTVSQCPVENGVLHSQWGAFTAGTVISGIAAGLQPQQVEVEGLNGRVIASESRFAATFAGDIAEAVLRQVPSTIQVGAAGGSNSTSIPRWHFLSQTDRFEMTDAEIRGGLDGLILGTNINQLRDRSLNLRLSQVLDMYYSQRGIFDLIDSVSVARACNRREIFPIVAPKSLLKDQAFAFTRILDDNMQTHVTLNPTSTARFATQASEALQFYICESPDFYFYSFVSIFEIFLCSKRYERLVLCSHISRSKRYNLAIVF